MSEHHQPILHVDQLLNRVYSAGPSYSHQRLTTGPDPQSWASRTYVVAPYGRMLCAMLASWHCPRANGQTLVNPTHSLSHGTEQAQVAMETGGLWLPRGNEKKERERWVGHISE